MGRPKIENKEPVRILSWRFEESFVKTFDAVHAASVKDNKTKADLIRRLVIKEAKRLKIPSV